MALEIKNVTVEPGDTLFNIAKEHLGSGKRWKEVFIANAAVLANQTAVQELPELVGPNFIWPGTQLQIVIGDFEDFKPSAN
jgi:nucleoid-associated protein YgaU